MSLRQMLRPGKRACGKCCDKAEKYAETPVKQ